MSAAECFSIVEPWIPWAFLGGVAVMALGVLTAVGWYELRYRKALADERYLRRGLYL